MGVSKTKKDGFSQSKISILLFLLVLLLIVNFVLSQSVSVPETYFLGEEKIVVREKPVQDQDFIDGYKETYDNFADVRYELVEENTRKDFQLKVGNVPEEIKGFYMGNEDFAVHLLVCDLSSRKCAFRVNGEATRALYEDSNSEKPNAVEISPNYILKINSITFDFCDNRRFCDSHFQAYDVVDISIIPRGSLK